MKPFSLYYLVLALVALAVGAGVQGAPMSLRRRRAASVVTAIETILDDNKTCEIDGSDPNERPFGWLQRIARCDVNDAQCAGEVLEEVPQEGNLHILNLVDDNALFLLTMCSSSCCVSHLLHLFIFKLVDVSWEVEAMERIGPAATRSEGDVQADFIPRLYYGRRRGIQYHGNWFVPYFVNDIYRFRGGAYGGRFRGGAYGRSFGGIFGTISQFGNL